MKNAWSPTMIAVMAKVSENQKLVVVNQYTDGLRAKVCDENLKTMITSIKQLYGNIPIIVAGDFNRKQDKILLLGKELNLSVAESKPDAYTWSQKGKKKSHIDYFLSTM